MDQQSPARSTGWRNARWVVGALVLTVALSACLLEPPPGRGPAPTLNVTTEVANLDHPWDLAFANTGSETWMLYTERAGRITAKQLATGSQVGLLDVAAVNPFFVATGEGGLLGLAVDPEFASNRFVYACYTTSFDVTLTRYKLNSFTLGGLAFDANIITGMPVNPSGRHSGCRPRFQPGSNPPRLYVGTGDSANATAPQSLQSLGGKVLCINRDGNRCDGNPWIGYPGVDDRIVSWGHRNVQGIAFNAEGGGGWSIEHGSDRDDEINLLVAGDFGWNPDAPGPSTAYDESQPMTRPGAIGPSWSSGFPTIAPSGSTVLWGPQWKGWDRAIAMSVLKGQELLIVFMDFTGTANQGWTIALGDRGRLRSAVQGPDGNLYISTDNGGSTDQILKVVPS